MLELVWRCVAAVIESLVRVFQGLGVVQGVCQWAVYCSSGVAVVVMAGGYYPALYLGVQHRQVGR